MNLRQVRKKIKSISNVKKITKAMQMVSAVKMKKAQAAALDGAPYREGLEEIIKKVAGNIDRTISPLLQPSKKASNKHLVIFVSSNKGLCGAFHLNINRFLIRNTDFKNSDYITVGKKGAQFTSRMGGQVIAEYSSLTSASEVGAVFDLALSKFLDGTYTDVTVVYNKFISTLRSEQVKTTILPLSLPKELQSKAETKGEYLIEPSPEEIMDSLLRSYVEEMIRGAIISSEAVEHSARMLAMKNATDNAVDVIYNLSLLGNKIRQTKITMELLDMITAKESVEGN